MEALLQVAAKNVLQRGEKLGINQAVREAMGEIRRNVQNLQDARPQTPRGPPAGGERAASELDRRNKLLAAMLEEGLAGLRAIAADDLGDKAKSLEMIEIAAEKVQLVKACLEDPSADVPGDDGMDVVMESTPPAEVGPKPEGAARPASKSALVPDPVPAISALSLSDQDAVPQVSNPTSPPPSSRPDTHPTPSPTRPSITQPSFAWMLDEPSNTQDRPRPSTSDRPPSRSPGRTKASKKNAFLFGEVVPPDGEDGGEREIFGLEGAERGGKGLFG